MVKNQLSKHLIQNLYEYYDFETFHLLCFIITESHSIKKVNIRYCK